MKALQLRLGRKVRDSTRMSEEQDVNPSVVDVDLFNRITFIPGEDIDEKYLEVFEEFDRRMPIEL